jgi:hypothetical protein
MTGTIRDSANDILNQVGVEVGLEPVNDPWSSNDQSYRQLRYLINTAGEELSQLYPWEFLRKEQTFTTDGTGSYTLPTDFLYIINQSGWNRTDQNPLGGPLSPQAWQYLEASNLAGSLLVYYRLAGDAFLINNDTSGLSVAYEYISRNWVLDSTTGTTYIGKVQTGADQPLFNRTLISRMLKAKYLEAKGFDTSKAQADLNQAFQMLTARNRGAPILNTKVGARNYPLIGSQSIPDTGYGS